MEKERDAVIVNPSAARRAHSARSAMIGYYTDRRSEQGTNLSFVVSPRALLGYSGRCNCDIASSESNAASGPLPVPLVEPAAGSVR